MEWILSTRDKSGSLWIDEVVGTYRIIEGLEILGEYDNNTDAIADFRYFFPRG